MTRPLRAWLLFVAMAALPALAVLVVALRAASAERSRAREERLGERVAAAATLKRDVDGALARAKAELSAIPADATKTVLVAALERARPAFADAVVVASDGALVFPASPAVEPEAPPACVAARASLETAERDAARAKILSSCLELKSERGRYVWPLLALEDDVPASLADWLEAHGDRLSTAERRVLLERVGAAKLDAKARARAVAALQHGGSAHQTLSALLDDRTGDDVVEGNVRTHRGIALSMLRLLPTGLSGGYVVHQESIGRAPLVGDLVAVARPTGAPGDATDVIVAPGLAVRVVERDPAAAAARDRWAGDRIALVGVLSVALAVGLAALLFARTLRAQRLADLRTDFVAAVSHELRTPLASVRMFAELLERGDVSDDERPELFRALATESRRLGTTLERMLRFGALSRGKLGAEKQPVGLRTLAEEAAARFRVAHEGHAVVVEGPTDLEADADAGLLAVALDNLLSNAIKYAPNGAPYRILIAGEGRDVTLAVADQGPGLDSRSRARVFLPFERADDRLSRATEGTGVGLALVRGIARAHGGDATVETALGRGATFIVRFPKERR